MKYFITFLLFSAFWPGSQAHALLTTSTLPEGIRSPSFRFGTISNIGERYIEDGRLMGLGDVKSVILDTPTLTKINPDTQKLIQALNSFGNQQLGDHFNFGVLKIHTAPQVKYFSPIFAQGMTERWTLALGLPVIKYRNKISVSHDHSNLDYYRQQFSGLSKDLDAALNINLAQATNEALASKGYRALGDRDESYLGDAQVANVFKFFETPDQAMIYMAMLGLPTGPAYNPDDLAALNIFGRTTLSNTLAYSRRWGSRFTLLPFANYLVNFRDQITARVPTDEEDSLPGPEAKQRLTRGIGSTITLGTSLFYELSDAWIAGASYESSKKNSDQYSGREGTRYDLLGKNTHARAERAKFEITYSSVKSYFRKTALLPMMLSLEISDVIRGANVERQLVQDWNLILFF